MRQISFFFHCKTKNKFAFVFLFEIHDSEREIQWLKHTRTPLQGALSIKDALFLSGSNEILRLRPAGRKSMSFNQSQEETSIRVELLLRRPLWSSRSLCFLRCTCHKIHLPVFFISNCTHKTVKDWHFTTMLAHIAAGKILWQFGVDNVRKHV